MLLFNFRTHCVFVFYLPCHTLSVCTCDDAHTQAFKKNIKRKEHAVMCHSLIDIRLMSDVSHTSVCHTRVYVSPCLRGYLKCLLLLHDSLLDGFYCFFNGRNTAKGKLRH